MTNNKRETLIQKILMAQNAAAHQDSIQAVVRNAIGGLDIVPLNREFEQTPVVVVGTPDGRRISEGQANVLISMSVAGYTKEDVVHAAYALGYHAAERKLKRALAKIEALALDLKLELPLDEGAEHG